MKNEEFYRWQTESEACARFNGAIISLESLKNSPPFVTMGLSMIELDPVVDFYMFGE
jgi:hypothetical protein